MISAISAIILALLNFLAALFFIKLALKNESKFMKILFFSMGIRYASVLLIFWMSLQWFDLETKIFALTFLISIFVFLIFEILIINFR